MEAWRTIGGYPQYQVSDRGRVRRCRRDGHRVLKPVAASNGYYQICLYNGGKSRRVLVHALVAAAFLGPRPSPEHQINHLDGDKANNTAENLEYLTRRENRRHASATGLCARGLRNGAASLTDREVSAIKALLLAGSRQAALARRDGVGRSTVHRIASGANWAWLEPCAEEFEGFPAEGRLTDSPCSIAGREGSLPPTTLAVDAIHEISHELPSA